MEIDPTTKASPFMKPRSARPKAMKRTKISEVRMAPAPMAGWPSGKAPKAVSGKVQAQPVKLIARP